MAQVKFDPSTNNLVVEVHLEGKFSQNVYFVLDTGASFTILPWRLAQELGLKIDPQKTAKIITASSIETTLMTTVPKMSVLGKTARNVACLVHDLPPQTTVDGLLGLSFLKNFKLTVDFKKGVLSLE